jgi:predicted DNA-binding ribbon-helix-helix protein
MDWQTEQRRCVELDGRKACVSLESDFWECLEQIAVQCGTTLDRLVAEVGGDADKDDLSAVLRVFVLTHYQRGAGFLPLDADITSVAERAYPDKIPEKQKYH